MPRLTVIALVAIAFVAGLLVGTWRAAPTIQTGRADTAADGGGSIITDGWTYGFSPNTEWVDGQGQVHLGDQPECLVPMGPSVQVRFASVQVTQNGGEWRPVLWIDCSP